MNESIVLKLEKLENAILIVDNKVVESRYFMNQQELRIFTFMLASLNITKERKMIIVPVSILGDICELSNPHKGIVDACRKLMDKKIEERKIIDRGKKKGNEKWREINIFEECEYEEGYSFFKAKFTEAFIKFVTPRQIKKNGKLQDVEFTQSPLKSLVNLEGFYAYRFYWFLQQYKSLGKREMDFQELKEMLMVEDKYRYFADFERKVLKPAQKHLENTDMAFHYDLKKVKKRIVGIILYIIKTKNVQLGIDYKSSKFKLPTPALTGIKYELDRYKGIDFVIASGLFTDNQIEKIKQFKRPDLNRRVNAIKVKEDWKNIKDYFPEVIYDI